MYNVSILADRYKVGDLIGNGGMAEVHVGTDQRLNRKVAIKILKQQFADDPVFLARFRREAQSAAGLTNANIVGVYDSGEQLVTETLQDGTVREQHVPYIIMEYVEGKTLREILTEEGHLSTEDSTEIVESVLKALAYSHNAGIIHRDIKPGNVMITNTGEVKVMDFGIARAAAETTNTMTQSQGVVGTAQYLSPEQARGETVDARSDLYSVGCLFFELLTGRPPFIGDSPVSIAYQHVREAAPIASSFNADIPVVFDNIINKALAKDVNQRYSDANQFYSDLVSAISGQPVAADATQIFNPDEYLDDETRAMAPVAGGAKSPKAVVEAQSDGEMVLDEFAEEMARKKKLMIIAGSIIGGVVLIALIVLIVSSLLSGSNTETEKVRVPTISKNMSADTACKTLENVGLQCKIVDDDDSTEDKDKITGQDPAAGEEVDKGSTVKVKVSTGPAEGTIPKTIQGKSFEDAKKALESAGYTVSVKNADEARSSDCVNPATLTEPEEIALNEGACSIPEKMVAGTKPALGTSAKKGTTVSIYVSSGVATIPNLVGQTKDAAKKIIDSMHLKLNEGGEEESDTIPAGNVSSQTPGPGDQKTGSAVTVKYAKASEKVQVPGNLVGQSADYAKGQLVALGFNVTLVNGPITTDANLDGKVQSVSNAGNSIKKGETVTVTTWTYQAPAQPVVPSGTCSKGTGTESSASYANYKDQATCVSHGGTWTVARG